MRRVLFGAFLFLAACGGDSRSQSPGAVDPADARADRARFLLTAEAQRAIADIARTADQDALDTCLNAYVEDFGGPASPTEPVSKPSVAALRGFLVQCLAGNVPIDLRAARPQGEEMKTDHAGDARGSDIPVVKHMDSSSP
jgi:hypothetical protein